MARRQTSLKAMTLRLDMAEFNKLEQLAAAENRSPTNYVETLVLRDIAAKAETDRVITMLVPPDAAVAVPGPLARSEDESDERYVQRSKLIDELMRLSDAD